MAKKFDNIPGSSDLLKNIANIKKEANPDSQEIINLSIDLIDEEEMNDQIFDMDELARLEGLKDSILEYGVTNPARVWKKDDGRYLICAGHRRYRSSKMAGKDILPCIIKPWEPDPDKRRIEALDDNMTSRNETPLEKARAINQYIKSQENLHPDWSQGDIVEIIAKRYQMSSATVYRLQSLLDLIPELQKKAEEPDKFAYSGLVNAVKLTKEEQKKFNEKLDRYVETMGSERLNRDWYVETRKKIKSEREEKIVGNFPNKITNVNNDKSNSSAYIMPEEIDSATLKEHQDKQEEEKRKRYLKEIKDSSAKFMTMLEMTLECDERDRSVTLKTLNEVKTSLDKIIESI